MDIFQSIPVDFLPFTWAGVSGVADILMVMLNVVLLLTIIFGYHSMREGVRSRNAQVLIWAVKQMEEIKGDQKIFREAGDYDRNDPNWTEPQVEAAYRISHRLQRLAYMANHGLIHKQHLINMWGLTFVDCWDKMEPWVRELRKNKNEPENIEDGAFSRIDFEKFAKECRDKLGSQLSRTNKLS